VKESDPDQEGNGGTEDGSLPTTETSATTSPGKPRPPPEWLHLEGIPWPLLPCEAPLVEPLRSLAKASSAEDRDAAILECLRLHPFVEVKAPQHGKDPQDFGPPVGPCQEEHFRMNIRTFNKWLKTEEGRPFGKEAGGPSDDGIYTVSAVMRRCMPRGMSRFIFPEAKTSVIVRGFRKFTGLTAEDEDEESGATNMYENFYYAPDAPAAKFTVTTKSNGENGKFSIRRINDQILFFAGSKNTCLVWSEGQDIEKLHPPEADASVPGPLIASMMQKFWRGWDEERRSKFVDKVSPNAWTLMLEINCASHEHIFPIKDDFVEFVAVLDREGVPLPQKEAFAFFDEYGLPRVHCEEGLEIDQLASRLTVERAATDREGAVLYLETAAGATVGLLKVKSNFYVRARRTRQTFWGAIVDPLLRGDKKSEATDTSSSSGSSCWALAEKRLRTGMEGLKHVEGCAENWKEWADVAVGFVKWWQAKYEALPTPEAKTEFAHTAKARFGSIYRDYCRDAGLPGGDN